MKLYTKPELVEAKEALVSTIIKCQKSLLKLKANSSQKTLLTRRIKALTISVDLIEDRISALTNNEIK